MRRDVKILLFTIAAGGAWAGRPAVTGWLDEAELFRVTDVRVQGLRYVDRDDVLDLLALTPESSIWGDIGAWRRSLEGHPLVKSARIRRRVLCSRRTTTSSAGTCARGTARWACCTTS